MSGFQPKEIKKNSIEIDLEDDDLDIDTDIDEEDEIPQRQRSNTKPNTKNKSAKVVRDTSKKNKKEANNTKVIAFGIIATLVVISAIFISSKLSKKDEVPEEDPTPVVTQQPTEDKTKPGVPNLNGTGAEQNDNQLYDPSLITKDLNGNTLDPSFKVISSETVTDFISFKKFRAPMGDGLEFYWLEAEYKGVSYKVQVPYSVYSKLDREGITVVDMEVLNLEGGSKMITYMNVRKDAKSLLDKNR